MKNKIFVFLVLIIVLLSSCNNDKPTPKPRGYFRIDLPEKNTYKTYDDECPFTFEIPSYTFIVKKEQGYCWLDLYFPSNKATVWLTYKTLNNDLKAILEDSRELVYKHTVKADAIEEIPFINEEAKVYGTLYNLKGNTASAVEFYLTDSTTHFFRGSLYFEVPPNKDSLAPVIDFIREDIVHLIESFRWK